MNDRYGKYSNYNAQWKVNPKDPNTPFYNGITRRNRDMAERLPSRSQSTSLASANIKALRLYRHICRILPYIIKVHQIQHRTSADQAKIFIANYFRKNANLTDLALIDRDIDIGYETIHEAQWHHVQTGYLYKYLMSPSCQLHDHGIDRFDDYRGSKLNRPAASSFLKSFYKGHKSFEL